MREMAPLRTWLFQRIGHELPAVMVAIPAEDKVWTDAVVAQLALRLPPGSAIVYSQSWSTLTFKRNIIAREFLAQEQFEALLMLDSDVIPPPDAVERLLRHQLPIVGGLYFTRVAPHGPVAGNDDEDGTFQRLASFGGAEPLRRVDFIGAGCLLIRREAMQEIREPWFEWGQVPGVGEDDFFCKKAAEAGIPIYCDSSLECGHIGATTIDAEYVRAWQQTALGRRSMNGQLLATRGVR